MLQHRTTPPPAQRASPQRHLLSAFVIGLAGCATTGATLGSGVGDRFLEHPPYVAGNASPTAPRIVVLPVRFQRGASQPAQFDPSDSAGSPIGRLVAAMSTSLDSIGAARGWTRSTAVPAGVAPDVYFGCARDATLDCVERGDSTLGRRGTTMHLALGRPSTTWIAGAQELMTTTGATHALLVTLEVGQYWPRQSGLLGRKHVELGEGHDVSLPWLSSLESPVSVLQLTAVLVDRDGRGTRIAAEGIAVRRTPLLASAVGGQRLITDEDVAQVMSDRRADLPGNPLAWWVALQRVSSAVTR